MPKGVTKVGKGGGTGEPGSYQEVKPEGTITRNDKTHKLQKELGNGIVTDNTKAPTMTERPKALTDAGIPKEAVPMFTFGGDGTAVSYVTPQGETRIYNWLDPKDQKEAVEQYKQDTEGAPRLKEQWRALETGGGRPDEGAGAAQYRRARGLETSVPTTKDPRGGGAAMWDAARARRGL